MSHDDSKQKKVWTIGHSTNTLEDFLTLLRSFRIEAVVDVRSFPGSRRYPHFKKEALEVSLPAHDLRYIHLKSLGGRRKASDDSTNTAWRHPSFRGYADYMATEAFHEGIEQLEEIALQYRTAYMCSEVLWWRCHRAMVSDLLKVRGWEVIHIMGVEKEQEHPFTSPARVVDGELVYGDPAT